MSASLVRKALDETTFAVDEELEQLSKASKKKFKAKKKSKTLSKDKILRQSVKVLKALEYKLPSRTTGAKSKLESPSTQPVEVQPGSKKSSKKNNKQQNSSVFTEEDFEKFEKEYFVS